MKKTAIALMIGLSAVACDVRKTSNDIQREQQERIVAEGTSQVGMPAITNFRERKLLKDIYELRDQDGLVTYTYLYNEFSGKLVFFCNSIGYGIPYAAQFSAPESAQHYMVGANGDSQHYYVGVEKLPQPEPNGNFSPESAEGTWVMCADPHGKATKPVYVEPRIIVAPFKLEN